MTPPTQEQEGHRVCRRQLEQVEAQSAEARAEVERLKAEQADLRKANLGLGKGLAEQGSKLRQAEAEVERLKAINETAADNWARLSNKHEQAEDRLAKVVEILKYGLKQERGLQACRDALAAAQPEEEKPGFLDHWSRDPESLVCREDCPACAAQPEKENWATRLKAQHEQEQVREHRICRRQLAKALKKFGNHNGRCRLMLGGDRCTCGYSAALAAAQPEEESR